MAAMSRNPDLPSKQGLYDPSAEHDACGVNFVANMRGRRSHAIVQMGLGALCNLEHRGAVGSDPNSGDGAGLLVQMPHEFLSAVVDFKLPEPGHYACGIGFMPQGETEAASAADEIERIVAEEGMQLLGWRDVPVDPAILGGASARTMPRFRQVFLAADGLSDLDLDRRCYIVRKRIEHDISLAAGDDEINEAMGGASEAHDGVYFPSLSSRTIVYKGMLTTPQLGAFYPDLGDERFESAIALVHSRFSTNTFPSWPLAHPYRFVAHNGEINTVKGNANWMRAREALLSSDAFGEDLAKLFPICSPGASDTATFDEALELLHLGGYSLPEAVLMMIPEPWEHHELMPQEIRDYYRYHASLMEPWDGPASIAFTDGTVMGAVLDRNGLRPSRYWVTDDDIVIMASEVGVVDVPANKIIEKGRLQPGRMFLIDTRQGRIIRDDEIKHGLASGAPYGEWLNQHQLAIDQLESAAEREDSETLTARQQAYGYTHEELKLLVAPMARTAKEAIGSMGTDTPVAALSNRPRMLFDYFQQLFAQVTNPPLDAIREEIITATLSWIGPEGNLLERSPASCRQIVTPHPVLRNSELAAIVALDGHREFRSAVVSTLFDPSTGGAGMRAAIERVRADVDAAIGEGANIIVLSDRGTAEGQVGIPIALVTGGVHHHLVRNKTRTQVGLVVETAEAREVHHMAVLLGYGANAVNPYLAFESIDALLLDSLYRLPADLTRDEAHTNYVKACDKGLLKVMSKMGISTVKSYIGAQIFEAIGLGDEVVDECFAGTTSRIGGADFDRLAEAVASRHALAYPTVSTERAHRDLEVGGEYQWRREGEYHLFNPETVFRLQHATREGRYDIFKQYTSAVDDASSNLATLRGLFRFKLEDCTPIPIEDVESAEQIVKRFATGAMSYGSISAEAHETLAIAMNRIGGKSNTGEGGEASYRYVPDANGDSRRSSIKQAASGRFGVTSEYLAQSDDIQIKMAQGAKPGEGGQLPGHKVWPWIAEVRHSTPAVELISPPPHHDIYSIEDLAQLIHDLKNANPRARIHVKLVSEFGVGTVAAGVSKAHADVVLISGHDGGTGASPLTSIKHAGTPWELGLAETQQTLLLNDLRDRIVVQVDGQLKTGRDVMIAALLGGEEFGFATAPLVVMGCVMMRVCHLDTCPVGVATQNKELRNKFSGRADHVVNFMMYVAEEVRELLAQMGLRSIEEAVGRVELLDTTEAEQHWQSSGLDLSPVLYLPELADGAARLCTTTQDHGLEKALDVEITAQAQPAILRGDPVEIELPITNVNRTVGTMTGFEVTTRWGANGLPDDTIHVKLRGSAGNSLGAFVPKGITLDLTGDANDYVGKGLSGGKLVVQAPSDAAYEPEDNVIAGNVCLYGATSGEAYFQGHVGERFCVRNSGAIAVVEGVGDHGCEYMTGGRAVILGSAGRNFGAGMSGGTAYVYDSNGTFPSRVNTEMVDVERPDPSEQDTIRADIEQHFAYTQSARAQRLLANWDEEKTRFRKVIPRQYKLVLEALENAQRSGVDPDIAVMATAQGV
ncbi:MAG: glutamate synthase large subunit [Actinomycetota bacterium]